MISNPRLHPSKSQKVEFLSENSRVRGWYGYHFDWFLELILLDFEVLCRIRHKTTMDFEWQLKSPLKIGLIWRHWNSESSYVGSDFLRHWFKKPKWIGSGLPLKSVLKSIQGFLHSYQWLFSRCDLYKLGIWDISRWNKNGEDLDKNALQR